MNKVTLKGGQARAALLRGITELNDMTKITLGPAGRNVIFSVGSQIISTKDGVTVAREMQLKDPFENYGAEVAKSVAGQAVDQAGDGTTTATLLIQAIFAAGVKAVEEGFEPTRVAAGIRRAAKAIVGDYNEKERHYEGGILEKFRIVITPELAFHVAKISSNGDEEIAKVVSDAVLDVGLEGAIDIGISQSPVHQLEKVEGLQIDAGLASPWFVNDTRRNRAVYEDCLIFLCDRRLSTEKETLNMLQKGVEQATGENKQFSILVIANNIDLQALGTMVGNKMKNQVNIVAVESPSWGPHRRDILNDIALITGATVIDSDKGKQYDSLPKSCFGKAARVVVGQQRTIITAYPMEKYDRERHFNPYIEQVRAMAQDVTMHPADKDRAQKRVAALTGGVAVVKVGGNSGDEVKERGFRVEDAIHATRAAVADGVVPGGGSALLFASHYYVAEDMKDPSEQRGEMIVLEAMQAPISQIATNAGHTSEDVIARVIRENNTTGLNRCGFNAKSGKQEHDMIEAGIVDPLKVVRSALNAAATAAAQLLLTEGIIAFEPIAPATETRMVPQG
jgi:chaperonin GroEL